MFFSQRALCNREEVHSQGDRGGICCKVFFKVIFIIIIIIIIIVIIYEYL